MTETSGGDLGRIDPEQMQWARQERQLADWIRQNGAANIPGLDADKFILGQVLECAAVGDDKNCFSVIIYPRLQNRPDYPQMLHTGQAQILERLDWERNTPEVPESIRNQLTQVANFISSQPPWDRQAAEAAYQEWQNMKGSIQTAINQEPNLQDALAYAAGMRGEVSVAYSRSQNP